MSALMSALSVSSCAGAYQPYQLQAPTQQPAVTSSAKNITQNPVPTTQSAMQAGDSDTDATGGSASGGGSTGSLGNTIDVMA